MRFHLEPPCKSSCAHPIFAQCISQCNYQSPSHPLTLSQRGHGLCQDVNGAGAAHLRSVPPVPRPGHANFTNFHESRFYLHVNSCQFVARICPVVLLPITAFALECCSTHQGYTARTKIGIISISRGNLSGFGKPDRSLPRIIEMIRK